MTALCGSWKLATTERERNRVLSELWPLLNTALTHYVRIHGAAYGHIDTEDARDIASDKAMVFLRSIESDSPASAAPEAASVCAYLSTLARNGLVDTLRKEGRKRAMQLRMGEAAAPERTLVSESAEIRLMHSQFIEAICACVGAMTPRTRSVWFMRAFLDLPSKKIALHPDVRMTAAGVDMLLSRARRSLRACMTAKGFDAEDAPQGTFVALWDVLRRSVANTQGSDDDP